MARAQDVVYKVSYKKSTREVSRAQLKKAPDSLISRYFLQGDHEAGEEFQLRYYVDNVPSHQAWPEGDPELFEVCMDCYTCPAGTSSKARRLFSATTLKAAVIDFFKLPPKLWPQGLRVAMKAFEQREQLQTLAEGLLGKCILWMEADMSKASALIDNNLDTKYAFYFERKTPPAGRPSTGAGIPEQVTPKLMGNRNIFGSGTVTSPSDTSIQITMAMQQALQKAGKQIQIGVSFRSMAPKEGCEGASHCMMLDCHVVC